MDCNSNNSNNYNTNPKKNIFIITVQNTRLRTINYNYIVLDLIYYNNRFL